MQLLEEAIIFTNQMEDVIDLSKTVKDLGVIIDNESNFNKQRHQVIRKTLQKAGWILRTFKTRKMSHMNTLWTSLAQPHQDYCSQLWSPVNLSQQIMNQESHLKAFTKKIWGLYDLSYWERLQRLNMSSIQHRHERYKIIYVWKTINNIVPNFGITINPNSKKRHHPNYPKFQMQGWCNPNTTWPEPTGGRSLTL